MAREDPSVVVRPPRARILRRANSPEPHPSPSNPGSPSQPPLQKETSAVTQFTEAGQQSKWQGKRHHSTNDRNSIAQPQS